ncbi:histidine phosphatase family protein [Sphaerotilus sp.]|uniref:histidine phosphatase family protein n=1 Tax=Sphaerotilus sp. TaxID=2093942 RepID=UPI002ACE3411|nr:histidine phosphatase family protein [Sphaerotilus sp.]MDZ7855791.1 histidine phosphatase family protein [Sphaerotilus sp.]
MVESAPLIWAWRHPRPEGAQGRCVGRTDLPVDPRRAKRLARRIQAAASRHGLPRVVHTSPLRRCADVGRWLRRWGWRHCIDSRLLEMDFGVWDGRPWHSISKPEVDAWCADFARTAPGGGECLQAMFERVAVWETTSPCVVVAHAGWMQVRRWHAARRPAPSKAQEWSAGPVYGEVWRLR